MLEYLVLGIITIIIILIISYVSCKNAPTTEGFGTCYGGDPRQGFGSLAQRDYASVMGNTIPTDTNYSKTLSCDSHSHESMTSSEFSGSDACNCSQCKLGDGGSYEFNNIVHGNEHKNSLTSDILKGIETPIQFTEARMGIPSNSPGSDSTSKEGIVGEPMVAPQAQNSYYTSYKGPAIHVIYYYIPGCPYCQIFDDTWNELQSRMSGDNVVFVTRDITKVKTHIQSAPAIEKICKGTTYKYNGQLQVVDNLHKWIMNPVHCGYVTKQSLVPGSFYS
jgi:hypothetical protein